MSSPALNLLQQTLIDRNNPPTVLHSARSAFAAVASLLIARWCRLPESYWAPITTLVVMQSSVLDSMPLSIQRLAGTLVGGLAGAFLTRWFSGNVVAFGAGVLLLGLLFTAGRIDRHAYRYASITLAIIMLVRQTGPAWITALHRCFGVVLGVAVALAVAWVWKEGKSLAAESR